MSTQTPTVKPVKLDYWLRKKGTYECWPRTKALAERDDMEPVSAEEARRCIALLEQKNKQDAAARAARLNAESSNPAPSQPATESVPDIDAEERSRLEAEGLVPPASDEAPAGDAQKPIEEMDSFELRQMAATLKIAVGDNWKDETIRAHIRRASEADAE